jgi:biotin carboxyl carrier protein
VGRAAGLGTWNPTAVRFVATVGAEPTTLDVNGADGRYRVVIGDRVWQVDARLTPQGLCRLLIDGVPQVAGLTEENGATVVDVGGETYVVQVEEETRYLIRTRGGAGGGHAEQTMVAPLPGRITHVAVAPGDTVQPGDTLLVIEAMKMENEFKARAAGRVAEVRVQAGQAVNAGDVLLVIGR